MTMTEDEHLDADITNWLNAPVEGENLPQGMTNGSIVANDPAWFAAVANGETAAYLETRAGFGELWNRIVARARAVVASIIFVDWVTDWWLTNGGGAG